MEAKYEFDECSRLVKAEVARFEKERIEDFKSSLEAFLEGMISRQKQVSFISHRTASCPRRLIASWITADWGLGGLSADAAEACCWITVADS